MFIEYEFTDVWLKTHKIFLDDVYALTKYHAEPKYGMRYYVHWTDKGQEYNAEVASWEFYDLKYELNKYNIKVKEEIYSK